MKNKQLKIITEFCRILTGAVFIFSGTVKSIDPTGSAIKIEEYMESFGMGYFSWMEMPLSFGLSSLEFALGACLLLGVYRKWVTLGILAFMSVMTLLTLYLALYNPVADCGCFGDALILTNWQTFYKNLVLTAAVVTIFVFRKYLTPFYTRKVYWFVPVFVFFFCIGFCYWNYAHLPAVDFRPYRIGENIPKMMEIPAGAPQDEYRFVYKKDGVVKEFSLEESPVNDSTWTYVDAILVKQGFVPKIGSFEFYDENGENIADRILTQSEAVLMLVSPRIEHASEKHASQINSLHDFTKENDGFSFYCVTGSSEQEIAGWKKDTGADYPFLTTDDVILKTMIRANPGLLLLKEGTILGKWHHNDMPEPEELAAILSDYKEYISSFGADAKWIPASFVQKGRFWLYIVLAFALPLLAIWMYDFFRNRTLKRK
ncbi:MAG: DoxX family protein [Tannerella sp.]|jgi:uncharacterized membrane protein YphA (DoxX/SURF4 family)|nr:DoxX family protein [Tannerella sp.]